MVSGWRRLALWPGWLYLDPRDSLGRLAITSVILSLLPHLKKKRGGGNTVSKTIYVEQTREAHSA